MISTIRIDSGVGLLILGIFTLLTFVITVVTLIISRKYLHTKISLSLEIVRNPNPQYEREKEDGSSVKHGDNKDPTSG